MISTDYDALAFRFVQYALEPEVGSVIRTSDLVPAFNAWLEALPDAPVCSTWRNRKLVPHLDRALSGAGIRYRLGRIKRDDRVSTPDGYTIVPAHASVRGWWGVKFKAPLDS